MLPWVPLLTAGVICSRSAGENDLVDTAPFQTLGYASFYYTETYRT